MFYQVPDVQQCQSGEGGKKTFLHQSIGLLRTTQCPQTKLDQPGTKHVWHSSENSVYFSLCLSVQLMEILKHYHDLI